jgi:pyruvate,water dikinase
MPWLPLDRFRADAVPKLNNLRRAAAAGLRVPPTWWLPAAVALSESAGEPPPALAEPLILRSGSPTEDTRHTSNAGQLLSLVVHKREDFATALARVVEALPCDAAGRRLGAVFAQPLVRADEAGVAFCDGYYFEQTCATGGNEALTSGQERGTVRRGQYERGEPWSEWLRAVYVVFAAERRIDVEYARDAQGYVLLQVRPALFALARNPTLTLANHKETLGERPSPFIVSALVEAGRDLSFLCELTPACRHWDEVYAVELAGQAWLNLSLWFRWMDHFGLPRTLATAGIGGDLGNPADARTIRGRFWRSVPRLLWQQWLCLQKVREVEKNLKLLDDAIDRARDVRTLYAATVQGLAMSLSTNFAIAALCSLFGGVRRALCIPGTARLVTHDMMDAHRRLFALPVAERRAALDAWLRQYGHRGPLESDLARPRFAELAEVLWRDLQAAPTAGVTEAPAAAPVRGRWLRLFSWIDERREWFRDQTMRRWQRLRALLLAEGVRLVERGDLDQADEVFWLSGLDLSGTVPLRHAVAAAKERAAELESVVLPLTATRERIEAVLTEAGRAQAEEAGRRVFPGIALGPAVVEGRAVKADSLTTLLTDGTLNGDAAAGVILVVPSLEPSWAVVFPRVAGVVAEVGGELSHASILLREAGRPAVVNCAGVFRQVRTGDRLRLDGTRALVEVL